MQSLLEYSRNPLEHFLEAEDGASKDWFIKHGERETLNWFAAMRKSPLTKSLKVAVKAKKCASRFGLPVEPFHRAQVNVRLLLRDGTDVERGTFGTAPSAGHARAIALAECLERLGFASATGTYGGPNGNAFHSSAASALKRSFGELAERDTILSHWYSHQKLPVTLISDKHPLHDITGKLAKKGWTLREHRWQEAQTGVVTVGISLTREGKYLDHEQWNFHFGSSADPLYETALDKALGEAALTFELFSEKSVGVPDTRRKYSPEDLQEMLHRIAFMQTPKYLDFFASKLQDPLPAPKNPTPANEVEFVSRCLKAHPAAKIMPLPVPTPMRDHVYCVRVIDPELQTLDHEYPPLINARRVEKLHGTPASGLNQIPHPIL